MIGREREERKVNKQAKNRTKTRIDKKRMQKRGKNRKKKITGRTTEMKET